MLNLGDGLYVLRVGIDFYAIQLVQRKVWEVAHVGASPGTLVQFLAQFLGTPRPMLGTSEMYHCSFKEVRRRLYGKGGK